MSTTPAAQSAKRKPAKRPTIHQRTAELAIAERDIAVLKRLLRDASPPFGRTAEVKRAWVEARENELNRE